MLKVNKKNLGVPDETIQFPRGTAAIVTVGESTIARVTVQPGWKWSNDVRPLTKTDTCGVRHMAYIVSGRLVVAQNDGTQIELSAGDYAIIPPGHDSWVAGNEPCTFIDFAGLQGYTKASLVEGLQENVGVVLDFD